MGLDMYLTGDKYFHENPAIDEGYQVKSHRLRLGQWRKHPNLHGYIVENFAEGEDECQEIQLEDTDIRQILQAIKDNALPFTEGFFFGESDGSEKQEDIEIFTKALEWLLNPSIRR